MIKTFLNTIYIFTTIMMFGCSNKSSEKVKEKSDFSKMELDTVREYHANGNIKSYGVKVGEKKEGAWKYFFENGRLGARGEFHEDFKLSEWEYFTESKPNLLAEQITWGVFDDSISLKINVPIQWNKINANENYIVAYVKNDHETFKSNFSINRVNYDLNFNNFFQMKINAVLKEFSDYGQKSAIINNGEININGARSKWCSFYIETGSNRVKMFQVFVPRNDEKLYLLTFTSQEDKYDDLLRLYNEIIMSIRFY